jgi:sigma-B regulation protein RsbU (phosphoserine phosphatase)
MQILIADDDKIARSVLQFQLENWGYTVLTAENGAQAWDLLQRHDCSILITDWCMPEMDGLELLQKLRSSQLAHYVYAILLTSRSERKSLITGLTTGADDFLTKPVDQDELKVRLQPARRISELERRLDTQRQELEVRNAELSEANTRMQQDLLAAAKIQQSFLPTSARSSTDLSFDWHYSPCHELGGDMLNVLDLDDEHLGIYLLDVSGHGVQAALLAVTACRFLSPHRDASSVLWQSRVGSDDYDLRSPAAMLQLLNQRMLGQSLGEQFFTLLYGVLNRNTGEFRYANAGHPSPLWLSARGRATFLPGDGLPIGIAESEYDEHQLQLGSGDRLLFYSDGIIESMNGDGQTFGQERLLQSVCSSFRQPFESTLPYLLDKLQIWCDKTPHHDDLSLLAMQFSHREERLARLNRHQWSTSNAAPTMLNESSRPATAALPLHPMALCRS